MLAGVIGRTVLSVLDRNPREEVHRITDAGAALSDDQAGRTRRYLISMGIRTACFVGAVLAPSPWRWVLVVGAVCLPYVAVVMANAGRERSDRQGFSVALRPQRRMLGGGDAGTKPAA
jgi:Flp pilus assembly protein TadB